MSLADIGKVDDAAITSAIQSRLAEDQTVDAKAIGVETANGAVILSGPARSSIEKNTIESVARKVKGVRVVQNNVAVQAIVKAP